MVKHISVISWALVGVIGLGALSGCKSAADRAHDVAAREVERCLASTETFAEIRLANKTKVKVLREACEVPLGEVTMLNKLQSKVHSGPIEWRVDASGEGGAWVLMTASWENLDRAQGFRRDSDATADEYSRAEAAYAAAQEELPTSGWLRLERLKNLLDLRGKTLKAGDPEPTNIGDAARKHYEETLAWAKESNKPEVDAEARVMVVDHLRRYRNRQLSALDAIGSQDEWLEKSISEALKEGNKDEAAKIEAELAERRENAVKDRVTVQERIDKAQANICAEVKGLSADKLIVPELREKVEGVLAANPCQPVEANAE